MEARLAYVDKYYRWVATKKYKTEGWRYVLKSDDLNARNEKIKAYEH